MTEELGLIRFNRMCQAIVEAKTIDEVKEIHNKALAAQIYARQAKMGLEAQNNVAEIRLRAERKAGELLAEMRSSHTTSSNRTADDPPVLRDIGISKDQSSNWQRIAAIPVETFEEHLAETKADERELTTAGLVRIAKQIERESVQPESEPPPLPDSTYRALVIDPPWPMEKILRDVRPNQAAMDYPMMSLDEIAALPIPELADPSGCHVYLWTTHKFLPDALRLFEIWGVRYQCIMTWVKNVGFTPFSWMYSTEHVLFGRIGSLDLLQLGLRLDFAAKVREHSRKPEIFYDLVRQASPGPRLDMFAREPHNGFETWGNEPDKWDTQPILALS